MLILTLANTWKCHVITISHVIIF